MSKRGGASEINGFISINADDKKSTLNRKDNEKTTKAVRGETSSRQHRDQSQEKSKNVKTTVSKNRSSKESPIPIAQRTKREGQQIEKTIKVKETPSTSRIASKLKSEVSSSTPSPRSSKTLDPHKNVDGIKHKSQVSKLKSTSISNRNQEPQRQRNPKTEAESNQNFSPNIKTKNTKVLDTPSNTKRSPMIGTLTKQSTFSFSDKKSSESTIKRKSTTQAKSSTRSIYASPSKNTQSSKIRTEKSQNTKTASTENKINSIDYIVNRKQPADVYKYEEASNSLTQRQREDEAEDTYDYEDDFEDYESDFEEYVPSEDNTDTLSEEETETETETDIATETNSQTTEIEKHNKPSKVEEERKLDSGSYDLTSNGDLRRKKQIQEIKNAIDKENATVISSADVSISPEDEGFEDVQSRDSTPTFMEINTTTNLINFTKARKRQIKQKAKEKVKHRGALLLDMIKLDVMNFNLFDLPPVPYEVYIKCYGRSNTQQMHSQTGEDNLSEEVQTDEIMCSTKWTQHPVNFSSPVSMDHYTFIQIFSQERLGVGGEITLQENEKWNPKLQINTLHLHNFISAAGEVMLILLEESEKESQNINILSHNKQDFGFSDGFTDLNVQSVPFLKDRSVNLVCFSQSNCYQILTVHQPSSEQPKNIQQESEGRCLLCVWSILEPSSPQKILVASNNVTAVSFHSHLVFAGLLDGSLCLWDLREKGAHHQQSILKQYDWLLRSPTYITGVGMAYKMDLLGTNEIFELIMNPENGDESDVELNNSEIVHSVNRTDAELISSEGISLVSESNPNMDEEMDVEEHIFTFIAEVLKETGHLSGVVSVQVLPEDTSKVETPPKQVVTVDEEGILIVWTVIESTFPISTDMGMAHWGKVRLTPSSRLCVLECFSREERWKVQCQCLAVDLLKPSNLYIGTNTGQVVHCLQSSTKTRPQIYLNNTEELSSISCIEFSKCGQPTLMVGDTEGRVRVYRTTTENPILNVFATVASPSPGVKSLQMSPCHPGLFFVLDTQSSLHVWNLCTGDLYPMFSVPFKDQVICTAQLSPHSGVNQMALATTSGQVQIHHLKSEFCQQLPEVQLKENIKFERYINIL